MDAIICGGRDYRFTHADWTFLDELHRELRITRVIAGRAPGADHWGEEWAKSRNIHVDPVPAAWGGVCGPREGHRRNQRMAEMVRSPAICIAFPGGEGTADMIRRARRRGIRVITSWGALVTSRDPT